MRLLFVLLLLIPSYTFAAEGEDIPCQVIAETGSHGFDDHKETPFTELRIVSAEGEHCPDNYKNAIYRSSQPLKFTKISAHVKEGSVLNSTNQTVYFLSWSNIKDLSEDISDPIADFNTSAPDPQSCVAKGVAIPSDQVERLFCCEGSTPSIKALVEGSCEEKTDGAMCIACGDGICEGPQEDSCNCPQDCGGNNVPV